MTLLIKNGLVYDGSEKPPGKKDILIANGKIIRLGSFPGLKADEIIEATGAMVMPGFIDIASTIDHYFEIFSASVQAKLLSRGITTVIGGNQGFSLAPFTKKSYSLVNEMGDNHYRNVNWHSVEDFLKILQQRKSHLNFGTLVGYVTVRESLTKGEPRDLSDHELRAMMRIFGQSFKEGAFGFSLDLEYFYSRRVPYYEIKALAEVAARFRKVMAIGLRQTKEKLEEAVAEIMRLAKETSVNIEIRHFAPLRNFTNEYLIAKDLFEKTSAENRINFDLSPAGETAMPLCNLLPNWFQSNNLKKMADDLKNPAVKEMLLDHLAKFDLTKIRINRVPQTLEFLEGKTLRDFAGSRGLTDAAAILKFMQITELQALIAVQNVDLKAIGEFLVSPKAIVSADVFTDSFINLINEVGKTNLMPLEKAIAKMTSWPAQKYHLTGRGLIKEGYFADLVVIHNEQVQDVVLNGSRVFEGGRARPFAAGAVLKMAHS